MSEDEHQKEIMREMDEIINSREVGNNEDRKKRLIYLSIKLGEIIYSSSTTKAG